MTTSGKERGGERGQSENGLGRDKSNPGEKEREREREKWESRKAP